MTGRRDVGSNNRLFAAAGKLTSALWPFSSVTASEFNEALHMGRGGAGNFHSDDAADFAGFLIEDLVSKVASAIEDSAKIKPDSYYGEVVPAIIDIVASLHELTGVASIPRPETVGKWKAKFMGVWEAHIDGLDSSPQHKKARRTVLRKTFDRLARLARKQYK